MEKISIARRRIEKQKFPFSIKPTFSNDILSSSAAITMNTIQSPPKMNALKVSSNTLVSMITEEITSLHRGKKEFSVEIISGLQDPLRLIVSVQSFNTTSRNDKKFLTTDEAAQSLRVSKNTIYRQLRSGNLQGQKIGRQWRILLTSLNSKKKYKRGDA